MDTGQQKKSHAEVERIHSVLLIESDRQLRSFWQTALTGGGFQVVLAATPDDALQQAAQKAPDLVFLGTRLDGSKAVETLEALRQICPDLLVVAPTDPKQVREELDAMESGRADMPAHLISRQRWMTQ